MRLSISWLVVAVLVGSVFTYPASRKLDLAEELLAEESDGDYQYDEVELKPDEAIKKSEVAREGSGAEPARKDDVSGIKPAEAVKGEATKKEEVVLKDNSKVVDNPESDESESPASGEEDSSGDDTADDTTSGNGVEDALEEGDATSRNGMTAALEEEGTKEKRHIVEDSPEGEEDSESEDSSDEDTGSTEDGSTGEPEDKGQENEAKKNDVASPKKRDCDCGCDEPDEEHEHEHQCHGQEECCHGEHCCDHEHGHDEGHHEHDDCCHHHGHHHGFVHEWGEECCGDHHCHDCCGEHEHEHHDEGDHHHQHCCDHNHCCHHEEEEEPHCCCDKRSKTHGRRNSKRFIVPLERLTEQSRYTQQPTIVKKQTVHVGYGYASGDNYRLGYQQGGMGGLASTFTGQIGAETQGNYDVAEHYNKRRANYMQGPIREKRYFGGDHSFGNMESGMAHGSATPYGHPVTHPGFTTMGFPGHALASQDVRNRISHPQVKRSTVYEEDYPLSGYTIWTSAY